MLALLLALQFRNLALHFAGVLLQQPVHILQPVEIDGAFRVQ